MEEDDVSMGDQSAQPNTAIKKRTSGGMKQKKAPMVGVTKWRYKPSQQQTDNWNMLQQAFQQSKQDYEEQMRLYWQQQPQQPQMYSQPSAQEQQVQVDGNVKRFYSYPLPSNSAQWSPVTASSSSPQIETQQLLSPPSIPNPSITYSQPPQQPLNYLPQQQQIQRSPRFSPTNSPPSLSVSPIPQEQYHAPHARNTLQRTATLNSTLYSAPSFIMTNPPHQQVQQQQQQQQQQQHSYHPYQRSPYPQHQQPYTQEPSAAMMVVPPTSREDLKWDSFIQQANNTNRNKQQQPPVQHIPVQTIYSSQQQQHQQHDVLQILNSSSVNSNNNSLVREIQSVSGSENHSPIHSQMSSASVSRDNSFSSSAHGSHHSLIHHPSSHVLEQVAQRLQQDQQQQQNVFSFPSQQSRMEPSGSSLIQRSQSAPYSIPQQQQHQQLQQQQQLQHLQPSQQATDANNSTVARTNSANRISIKNLLN